MFERHLRDGLVGLCFSFCLLVSQNGFADALTDEAERLINNGQYQQAYNLLIPELPNRAGQPDYDLLLGIAALDSGMPTIAVFAFERVLDVDPDNDRARAELGRAYFEAGENEAARDEFSMVDTTAIPSTVNESIEQYLEEIDTRLARASGRRISAYVDATIGYDTNVNSATDQDTIAIPAIGNISFTLDQTSQELDSGFLQAGLGGAFSIPIGDNGFGVFGGANFHEKYTWDASQFRIRNADAQAGVSYSKDNNQYRFSLMGQHFGLNNQAFRNLAGGRASWLHTLNESTVVTSYVQASAERYHVIPVRNVNQYTGGVGILHIMDRPGAPLISGTIFVGTDEEMDDNRPDIGRTFVGLRMGGTYTYSERITLQGDFTYQYSDYGADDPLFNDTRQDHFIFLSAGVEYQVTNNFSLKPEIQYINNDSTLPTNEYDRWQIMATARFDF